MRYVSVRSSSNQSGFGHVIAVGVLVVALGLIGVIGYKLYAKPVKTADASQSTKASPAAEAPMPATAVSATPNIQTTKDLDTAATTLDQNDPSTTFDSDASALDGQTAGF